SMRPMSIPLASGPSVNQGVTMDDDFCHSKPPSRMSSTRTYAVGLLMVNRYGVSWLAWLKLVIAPLEARCCIVRDWRFQLSVSSNGPRGTNVGANRMVLMSLAGMSAPKSCCRLIPTVWELLLPHPALW